MAAAADEQLEGNHAESEVAANLAAVQHQICEEATKLDVAAPRLVAVSKTKPGEAVLAAFNAGQRHFGENYVAELLGKAPELPAEIHWHFIGHLQSNKAKALVEGVPNLFVVESVDSGKLARKLDSAAGEVRPGLPLRVMVQVNTSGEASKSGAEPGDEALALCRCIELECGHLELMGLMTIGALELDRANECFELLRRTRDAAEAELPSTTADGRRLELSMGMSSDFIMALEHGTTNVRVGSSIFGARAAKKPPATDSAAPTPRCSS